MMTLKKWSFLMFCVLSCVLHTVFRCTYEVCLCSLLRHEQMEVRQKKNRTSVSDSGAWLSILRKMTKTAIVLSLLFGLFIVSHVYHSSTISHSLPSFLNMVMHVILWLLTRNCLLLRRDGVEICSTCIRR